MIKKTKFKAGDRVKWTSEGVEDEGVFSEYRKDLNWKECSADECWVDFITGRQLCLVKNLELIQDKEIIPSYPEPISITFTREELIYAAEDMMKKSHLINHYHDFGLLVSFINQLFKKL